MNTINSVSGECVNIIYPCDMSQCDFQQTTPVLFSLEATQFAYPAVYRAAYIFCVHPSSPVCLPSADGRSSHRAEERVFSKRVLTFPDSWDYHHFTVFSVSNEIEIAGNVHLRPSKTLHT